MFYHPELIVYLWLLPVFILIIVPVFFKVGCVLYCQTSWGRTTCSKEYSRQHNLKQAQERRKHSRVEIDGTSVQVACSGVYCTAMVENISSLGICLKNLPQALLNEAKKLKVIINTQAGNFEMHVKPKWEKSYKSGYKIGADIVST